jgi:hypothetical protein
MACDAVAEFRRVLDAKLRVLGPDHADIKTTRDALRRFSGAAS